MAELSKVQPQVTADAEALPKSARFYVPDSGGGLRCVVTASVTSSHRSEDTVAPGKFDHAALEKDLTAEELASLDVILRKLQGLTLSQDGEFT